MSVLSPLARPAAALVPLVLFAAACSGSVSLGPSGDSVSGSVGVTSGVGVSSGMGGGGLGGSGGTGGSGGAGGSGGTGGSVGECANVFQGDVQIIKDADIAAVAGYCEINGTLTIAGPASVTLPLLQRVDGPIQVETLSPQPQSLSFPALSYAKGFECTPGLGMLTAIDLGSLVTLDGDFIIPDGDIPSLSFPALTSVSGSMRIYFPIHVIDLPALESVGGLLQIANGQVSAPKLTSIGLSLGIGSQSLSVLDFPSLVSIGQASPPGAIALDLDPWVGSKPCFPDNGSPLLSTLHLPLLANLGSGNGGLLNRGYSPLLPQCQIDALATQLQNAGWTGHVQVADPTACQMSSASCP